MLLAIPFTMHQSFLIVTSSNLLSCKPIDSGQSLLPSFISPCERSLCKWRCTWSRRESPHKREIGPNVSSSRG